jgi:hypothetical protein
MVANIPSAILNIQTKGTFLTTKELLGRGGYMPVTKEECEKSLLFITRYKARYKLSDIKG